MPDDNGDIPEGLIHPARRGLVVDPKRRGGLAYVDLKTFTERSIVLLEFKSGGTPAHGSGFFVNIPFSELSDFELILTAGHNLVDPNGSDSTDLRISLTNGGNDHTPLDVHGYWVCKAFREQRKEAHDHAAILVKRTSQSPRGFGFSTKLGEKKDNYQDTLSGDLCVSGYRGQQPYTLTTSTGPFAYCFGDEHERVEYRISTEQGNSGSAVWLGYDGQPMAVAIHTNGPVRRGQGSRGCRLTKEFLHELFKWVGHSTNKPAELARFGVKLRVPVGDTKSSTWLELLKRGVYMNFSDAFPFARVRLGSGTLFDVLPVEILPGSKNLYYALIASGKWVRFVSGQKEGVLSDDIRDGCLFWMSKKKKGIALVFDRATAENRAWQLWMKKEMIEDLDDDDLEPETSAISWIEYPANAKTMVGDSLQS